MKTIFTDIHDNWKSVKNHCRATDNKDFTENEATEAFKKKLLISEHSPIRLLEFGWSWKSIMYWVSTEWSRHKFEKFISTSRDDRKHGEKDSFEVWDSESEQNIEYTPDSRNDFPQKKLVNFFGFANMQNLIDAWRKRLCGAATKDARNLAIDFKLELHKTHPLESDVLVPNCIYRWGCPEFASCSEIANFIKWCNDNNRTIQPLNIQSRYDLYNEYFHETNKQED